jgi:pilus assembly protein Flp/PilA
MKTVTNLFNRLRRDETGASLVEYGLLVGLIAVAAIAAITTLGGTISSYFENINTELTPPAP